MNAFGCCICNSSKTGLKPKAGIVGLKKSDTEYSLFEPVSVLQIYNYIDYCHDTQAYV